MAAIGLAPERWFGMLLVGKHRSRHSTMPAPAREDHQMSDVVRWVLELNIKDGELENFNTLMNDMVEATKANEPGTANYEWFVSGDGKQCHICERYVDSAAVMAHLANFGEKFAERFLAILDPTRLVVYGDPSSEARNALAGLGAIHMEQVGGYAR
jgi:quinol monooxygenase YgiN